MVCRVCGLLGYVNQKLRTAICSTFINGDHISTMKLPYACKLLIQHLSRCASRAQNTIKAAIRCFKALELQSMNIVPRLKLAEA